MRAKLGIGAALVLAAVSIGLVIGVPTASGQPDVHVFMTVEGSKFRFIGGPELTLGVRLAGKAPLLDASRSGRVGKAYQDCVVMGEIVGGTGGLYWCKYTLKLAGGTVVIEGLDPHGPGDYVFAVTGGTGTYASATGDAALTDSFEGTDMSIHFK